MVAICQVSTAKHQRWHTNDRHRCWTPEPVQELLFSGLLLAATTFKHHIILTEIAIIYFVICYPVALLATFLENRLRSKRKPLLRSWSESFRRSLPGVTRA